MTQNKKAQTPDNWPPEFSLDQEKILNLLTGDRFYSNPSAALREAVLNAVDAVHRRRREEPELCADIRVTFDSTKCQLEISDNGVGMGKADVSALFTKIGASAATAEAEKDAVGEFGIGVISYFMAADTFELQTYNGQSEAVALQFDRKMLAGGPSANIPATRSERGTSLVLHLRDDAILQLLKNEYPHWCRDVDGLSARELPGNEPIAQGSTGRIEHDVEIDLPDWIERSHLGPVDDPLGWDAMTGQSLVYILYRGVFVQQYEVNGLWGIRGSIDVDPKRFPPSLNREGFVGDEFKSQVEAFLKRVHPIILEEMAVVVKKASDEGRLNKWNENRWANLWLSVPRTTEYNVATSAWDTLFRSVPAFEFFKGDRWIPISLEQLIALPAPVYFAPLAHENPPETVKAAIRLLRSSRKSVVRGIQRDNSWMRYAGSSFSTTADLISNAFQDELPELIPIAQEADSILSNLSRVAPLFTGPPAIDLVRLGAETPAAIRLSHRLVINVDNTAGRAIVKEVLESNAGAASLIGIVARHAYEQLTQVAAVVREIKETEILSPVRRRFIRSHLP